MLLINRLDDDLLVKISDFGLTKDLHDKGYYRENTQDIDLPIRWMSPEAIEYGAFTVQCDVVC